MFTGIVETVGRVRSIEQADDVARIEVEASAVCEGVALGDSIAVNGACLTVAALDGGVLSFDAVRETLECTNLGNLEAGSDVNLERALRADGRLDGHIVQGHVDATGTVARLERQGDDVCFHVDCGGELANMLVDKGSVTIDGVSLTVVKTRPDGFHVVLIPHTLKETTLGARKPGERLNLEADILGKYVLRYLDRIAQQGGTPAR